MRRVWVYDRTFSEMLIGPIQVSKSGSNMLSEPRGIPRVEMDQKCWNQSAYRIEK